MSALAVLAILGLALWIVVAWLLLRSQRRHVPAELFDWRDQLAFALWPITIPMIFAWDAGVALWRKLKARP